MNGNNDFALVPRPPGALENGEPGAKRILSSMVADTLALARKETPQKSRPLRIVHVDDESDMLEMMKMVILDNFKNVTVETFQQGETAWQELMRADPDLLITDMNRVALSGWEMLRLLAERKVKYPVFVISGNATEELVRQCAGPDLKFTVLPKPFTLEEVLRELSIHLGPNDNPQRQVSLKTPRDTTKPV